MDDKETALKIAVEKLAVGAQRWSEQTPIQDLGRVVLLDDDCKLVCDYIASQCNRLELADQRINELEDMLGL